MNKNIMKIVVPTVVLVCGVLIGVIISQQSFFAENPSFLSFFAENLSFLNKDILSSEKAGEKTLDYINQNILKDSDLTASLTEEPVVKNGVYELKLKIGDSEFSSYLTRDGGLLFPEAIVLEEENLSPEESPQKSIGCEDVKKEQKPVLEAFVVAYCPYGTQMQRILVEIVKNIPELSENIRIEYIGQIQDEKIVAMHGEKEAQENLTQICLREEENSKYFSYLSCFLKKGDNQECLEEAGVDQEKIEGCQNDEARGLTYAQKDFDLQNKYQITGSPTLILNGGNISEFDFGGRTAEAVKTLLCCGFENNLAYCDKPLTEEQAATGFSETYGSGESGSGSCD